MKASTRSAVMRKRDRRCTITTTRKLRSTVFEYIQASISSLGHGEVRPQGKKGVALVDETSLIHNILQPTRTNFGISYNRWTVLLLVVVSCALLFHVFWHPKRPRSRPLRRLFAYVSPEATAAQRRWSRTYVEHVSAIRAETVPHDACTRIAFSQSMSLRSVSIRGSAANTVPACRGRR